MNNYEKSTLTLYALRAIKSGANIDPKEGICCNVKALYLKVYGSYRGLDISYFASWPEFSGNFIYPVAHKTQSPEDAYCSLPKWDKDTPYGQARWRLLDHLIKCYEKELGL